MALSLALGPWNWEKKLLTYELFPCFSRGSQGHPKTCVIYMCVTNSATGHS